MSLPAPPPSKPLRRSRSNRWIAGVCGGLAERLGWSPTVVRILWLVITLIPVLPGLPAYLLLWLLVPADKD